MPMGVLDAVNVHATDPQYRPVVWHINGNYVISSQVFTVDRNSNYTVCHPIWHLHFIIWIRNLKNIPCYISNISDKTSARFRMQHLQHMQCDVCKISQRTYAKYNVRQRQDSDWQAVLRANIHSPPKQHHADREINSPWRVLVFAYTVQDMMLFGRTCTLPSSSVGPSVNGSKYISAGCAIAYISEHRIAICFTTIQQQCRKFSALKT